MRRVLTGLVLLALGYVMVQLAQPYLHGYQFEQMIRREVSTGTLHAETGAVHRRVVNLAHDMGFIVSDEDVQVDRLVRGYQVRIHYVVPVDLKVYKSAVDFDSVIRTTTELQEGQ
jgi:hypothetical protein